MTALGIGSIFSTFGAGVLTSLTPCVYPMIPLTLGYLGSRGQDLNRRVVLLFALGQILMFALMGLVAVELGEVFGFVSQNAVVQIGTGSLLLAFSYFSWKSSLPGFLQKFSDLVATKTTPLTQKSKQSWYGPLIIGVISTLIASPCSTPVLGGVLALIAQSDSQLEGFFLMASYGTGMASLFLILGLGLVKTKQLPKSGVWMAVVHKISVSMLLFGGIYFIYQGVASWS